MPNIQLRQRGIGDIQALIEISTSPIRMKQLSQDQANNATVGDQQ